MHIERLANNEKANNKNCIKSVDIDNVNIGLRRET